MLKLDGPTEWSWFLVLSPMWILDVLLFILSLVQVCITTIPYLECYSTENVTLSRARSFWFMTFVISKVTFQTLLCLSADRVFSLPLSLIMSPLWIVFLIVCLDLAYSCFGIVSPSVKEFIHGRCEKSAAVTNQTQSRSTPLQPRNSCLSGSSGGNTQGSSANRRSETSNSTGDRASELTVPTRTRLRLLRNNNDGRTDEFVSA